MHTLTTIYRIDDPAHTTLEVKLDESGNSSMTESCYYCQHVARTPILEVDDNEVAGYYEYARGLRNIMTAIMLCKLFFSFNIFTKNQEV